MESTSTFYSGGLEQRRGAPAGGDSSHVSAQESLPSFSTINSQDSMGANVVTGEIYPGALSRNYGLSSERGDTRNNATAGSSLVSCRSDSSFVPVDSMTSDNSSFVPVKSSNGGAANGFSGNGSGRGFGESPVYSQFSRSGRTFGSGEVSGGARVLESRSERGFGRSSAWQYNLPRANGQSRTGSGEGRMSENGSGRGFGSSNSESGSSRTESGGNYDSRRTNSPNGLVNRREEEGTRGEGQQIVRAVRSTGSNGASSGSDLSSRQGNSGLLTHQNNRSHNSHLPSFSDHLGGHSNLRDGVHQNYDSMDRVANYADTRDRLDLSFNSLSLARGGHSPSSPPASLPTRKLQRVEVLWDKPLGNGAYGAVYQARCDTVLLCAAKVLHPILRSSLDDPKSPASRFNHEREWMSSFRHPNIVQYLGTHVEANNSFVLLMELMDESLTRFLDRMRVPLPFRKEVGICHDIAMALCYLHSNNILHRDLSSNNVLLIGDARAKVGDFGMATVFNNHRGELTGCPGAEVYMPPEVIDQRDANHTSKIDSFSLGVLMIQIATRIYPRPGDRTKLLPGGGQRVVVPEVERRHQHLEEMAQHPLTDLAVHCLSDDPIYRPSSRTLCRSLEEFRYQEERNGTVGQVRDESSSRHRGNNDSTFREYPGGDGKGDSESDKLKRKIAVLEGLLMDMRTQIDVAEQTRNASLDEVDKLKAKTEAQEKLLQRQERFDYSTANPLGSFGSLSLGSVEEDPMVSTSLPASHSSLPMEQPRLRSLSVSSADLASHDTAIVNRLCSIKFDVAVEEEVANNTVTLDATLTSLADGSTAKLMVEPPGKIVTSKNFSCKIIYTPKARGRHRITLSAEGKEEYSKEVFVSCSVSQLIKVVRRMTVPTGIYYLTIRDDFIYCTVPERGVFRLLNKNNCEELLSVKCNRKIRGVAIGPDSNIFITGDHVVQKYSPDGWKVLASYGGDRSVEFNTPSGVGFFNQEVFVCDTGNSRLVVCDLSLNRVRTISLMHRKNQDPVNFHAPEDVAFDKAGRVFVTDSGRKSVLICALDGNFLGEIQGDPSRSELRMPKAVRVFEDKVLVCDRGGRCIAVFDITSGKRVHKIPVQGDPVGLCIDQDCFIYVTCSSATGTYVLVY